MELKPLIMLYVRPLQLQNWTEGAKRVFAKNSQIHTLPRFQTQVAQQKSVHGLSARKRQHADSTHSIWPHCEAACARRHESARVAVLPGSFTRPNSEARSDRAPQLG